MANNLYSHTVSLQLLFLFSFLKISNGKNSIYALPLHEKMNIKRELVNVVRVIIMQ